MNNFKKYLKEKNYYGDISEHKDNLKKFDPYFDRVFEYIGIFLNQNILIETYLDDILELHLAKNRNGFNGAAFKAYLLNGRFFSIHEKQRIFGNLTKTTFLFYQLVKKEKAKKIRNLLTDVIYHRNIIAHNRFMMDVRSCNPVFQYYKEGKQTNFELSEELMIENLDKGILILNYLNSLSDKLKEFEE